MKKVLHITPKGCYINSFHTIVCNTNIICGSDAEYFFLYFDLHFCIEKRCDKKCYLFSAVEFYKLQRRVDVSI